MKKLVALSLSLTLVAALFAGCGKKAEGNGIKTGLGIITTANKSKDASADADGVAQFDSVIVGVVIGKDGKILDCKIDTAQTKINFSAAGAITTPQDTVFKSKQELGLEYDMKKASGIGKEWYEQADALSAYVIGKTVKEVKAIAVDESTKPTDAELAASVTVSIGGYVEAIEKAASNAKVLGANEGDKLGLAVNTSLEGSKDAADAEGVARAYSNYAAVTVNSTGTITSCAIDSSQSDVKFNAKGAITSDLAAQFQTKQELGEKYDMKKASGIKKEWNEQADAFAAYVVGKTADAVSGISLNEAGKVTDAELASSVTIGATPYISVVTKAVGNAK